MRAASQHAAAVRRSERGSRYLSDGTVTDDLQGEGKRESSAVSMSCSSECSRRAEWGCPEPSGSRRGVRARRGGRERGSEEASGARRGGRRTTHLMVCMAGEYGAGSSWCRASRARAGRGEGGRGEMGGGRQHTRAASARGPRRSSGSPAVRSAGSLVPSSLLAPTRRRPVRCSIWSMPPTFVGVSSESRAAHPRAGGLAWVPRASRTLCGPLRGAAGPREGGRGACGGRLMAAGAGGGSGTSERGGWG